MAADVEGNLGSMAYKPSSIDRFSLRYATHLPVLMQAVLKTDGSVLELGAGHFSTPVLHWMCALSKRELVSYDNQKRFLNWSRVYECDWHHLYYLEDWDGAEIDRPWDVALVDHSPSERRITDIKRLADTTKYIVIHDSNARYNRDYHYDTIYKLFKQQLNYDGVEPSTTVLSNLVDLRDFWEGGIGCGENADSRLWFPSAMLDASSISD